MVEYDNWHLFWMTVLYIIHLPAFFTTLFAMKAGIGVERNLLPAFLFEHIGVGPTFIFTTIVGFVVILAYFAHTGDLLKFGRRSMLFYSVMCVILGLDSICDILMTYHSPYAYPLFDAITFVPSLLHLTVG